jgi:HAMP domain-containing protein
MSSIFLSYAATDRARVEPLVKAMEARGFDVWWDRDISLGESYHRVIEQALERAACAIVIWSHNSVSSEWVTNEASEARKRGILVPALLDQVEPPLEFRHLQSANLFAWQGAMDDPEVQQLIRAVQRVVERGGTPMPPPPVGRRGDAGPAKSWWETPAGWAVGAAALILATGLLIVALSTTGLIGRPTRSPVEPAAQSDSAGRPAATTASSASAPSDGASRPANPPAGTINLLDVRDGAQIVAANEGGWKDYLFARDKPYCSVISTGGFVTFAFRDEGRARFDRLGVFVEATNSSNVKTVELHASDESDRGPFQKVGTFIVPNFRNERQPFHEFTFAPVTARYVKLVAVDWQERAGGPNGLVCTMQLMGTLQ